MRLRRFLSVIMCATVAAVVAAQGRDVRRFPEQSADLVSPRRDKSLHWEAPGNGRERHTVYLIDQATKKSIEVLSFSRHVSVGWAPTGGAFFATDFAGSDASRCLVFVLGNDSPKKRDLSEGLRISGLVPPKTWSSHHVFCEVLRWVDGDQLSIRLHGYGDADPRGFSKRYRYSLKGTFRADR